MDVLTFLGEYGFWIVAIFVSILSFGGVLEGLRRFIKELCDIAQVLDRFMIKLYISLDDGDISEEEYRDLLNEAWALVVEIKDLTAKFNPLEIFRRIPILGSLGEFSSGENHR
jgi:hypothetical protein